MGYCISNLFLDDSKRVNKMLKSVDYQQLSFFYNVLSISRLTLYNSLILSTLQIQSQTLKFGKVWDFLYITVINFKNE